MMPAGRQWGRYRGTRRFCRRPFAQGGILPAIRTCRRSTATTVQWSTG